MSLRDPVFAGVKVQKIPSGEWVLKCKARCVGPNVRPKARVASLEEAHAWAADHQRKHPEHERNWQAMSAAS